MSILSSGSRLPEKRVAIITGCSKGGIGFYLCEEYAAKGFVVYATSRNVNSMVGFTHSGINTLPLDVTSDDDVKQVVDMVIEREGKVDVLINNAGVIRIGPIVEVPMEQVIKTFDANVFGALRMARAVIPHMASRKQGAIINIGSIVGDIPTPWNGIYCASKAALHSITEVLQMECTPFKLTIVLVAPGSVKSNLAINHAKVLTELSPTSLYRSFIGQILARMQLSQGPKSMPTNVFAKKLVDELCQRGGPRRKIVLGGHIRQYNILKWLPRGLVLWLIWRAFSVSR